MDIAGKRVLITGAGRGLGRALALACATAGAREIFAGVRDPEVGVSLIEEVAGSGAALTPVKLDVTVGSDVDAAAQRAGRVDILINNAGIALFGGVFKASFEDVLREVEINYIGVIRMVRAFAPAMAEYGSGLILNIASQLGKVNLPALGTYSATKAALLSLSQGMRADLHDRGVRVVAVLPGTVDTDMSRGFDIPKMPVEKAAAEILDAIRDEPAEVAIGDDARRLLKDLAADPAGVVKTFSQLRA